MVNCCIGFRDGVSFFVGTDIPASHDCVNICFVDGLRKRTLCTGSRLSLGHSGVPDGQQCFQKTNKNL